MDNIFTNYKSLINLLALSLSHYHKLTVVGNVRLKETCIAPAFKKNYEINTTLFGLIVFLYYPLHV